MEHDRFRSSRVSTVHVQQQAQGTPLRQASADSAATTRKRVAVRGRMFVCIIIGALLTLLVLATVVLLLVRVNTNTADQNAASSWPVSRVDANNYQAVFLDGSSTTYFGKITAIQDGVIELQKVFYTVSKSGTTTISDLSDVTLNKLGCELHGPQDTMFINLDTVLFWENLNSDSQVSTAISSWYAANPSGKEDCTAVMDTSAEVTDE